MPRLARKESKSYYHHIMVQGINKEYIFRNEVYINKYLFLMREKLKESNVNILAYCIMNNHSHLLMYSEKSDYISRYMQRVNTAYSHFYNKNNKRVGYVFRDRYLSQDIFTTNQLYHCMRYIHNNPVKANMVKEMWDYKYSSYKEYLGRKHIITEESLKMIFGSTDNYIQLFNSIHTKCTDENFIDTKEKDIQQYISEFEESSKTNISDLTKNKSLLKEFINEARKETNVKIVELAQILGISKSTIANYIVKNNK